MKIRQLVLPLLNSHFAVAQPSNIFPTLDTYNIVWHSQSKNSGESMPVGGGDTGLNVWVEGGRCKPWTAKFSCFPPGPRIGRSI